MTREAPDTIKREAAGTRPQVEAAEQTADTGQPERCDDVARPVRYLWPALSSLWPAGMR